jgi:hypothetical protein
MLRCLLDSNVFAAAIKRWPGAVMGGFNGAARRMVISASTLFGPHRAANPKRPPARPRQRCQLDLTAGWQQETGHCTWPIPVQNPSIGSIRIACLYTFELILFCSSHTLAQCIDINGCSWQGHGRAANPDDRAVRHPPRQEKISHSRKRALCDMGDFKVRSRLSPPTRSERRKALS